MEEVVRIDNNNNNDNNNVEQQSSGSGKSGKALKMYLTKEQVRFIQRVKRYRKYLLLIASIPEGKEDSFVLAWLFTQ